MITDKRQHVARCNCCGTCTVALFTDWDIDDDFPEHTTVDLYEHIMCQHTLRHRLKIAWKVIRGLDPFTHGLLLDRPDARALGEFLLAGPKGDE